MPSLPNISQIRYKNIRKLKQKKYRKSTNRYICEGFRLLEEAFSVPEIRISELVVDENIQSSSSGKLIIRKAQSKKIPVFLANAAAIKTLSDEVTPSGIIFIVEQPTPANQLLYDIDDDIVLYLDRISEAGNLGTIIRSAAWFGLKTIIMSPGCVDPKNAKSIRASAGGIFKLKLFHDVQLDSLLSHFKNKHYKFIASVVSGGTPLNRWKKSGKSIIFLGQEASGLSEDIIQAADTLLSIPNNGSMESLNVSMAGGIILYEMFR